MTVEKKQLLDALKKCMPGIENGKSTLQGADAFIFHNGNIHSYNDVVSVTVPIEQSGLIDETVEGAVKADEFFKIISKMPSSEIDFEVAEKSWILKSGKAKVEMTLLDFDFETRLNNLSMDGEWNKITDEFLDALSSCKMSNNKTALSGIYINGENVISTDGYQMNKYTMSENKLSEFWLTDNSVNEILKLNNLSEIQLNGSWVHFKTNDNSIFSVKTLMTEKFPYDKVCAVLDTSSPTEEDLHNTFPAEMFNAIDRAVSFGMETDSRIVVRLRMTNNGIEVFAERTSGKYTENVDWENPIEKEFDITVYVDPIMMEFVAKNGNEFYILQNSKLPRLLCKTEKSTNLLSTFIMND